MTDKQRELARHALGLPNKENMTCRNHFCVAEGSDDYEAWQDLVKQGLVVFASGHGNWSGDFFYLTLEGAKAVLTPKEHISREDAEKMRSFKTA